MGNQYKRELSPEIELEIATQFSLGKKAKQVAYDLGLKLSSVYEARERIPLFAWHKDD